MAKGTRGTRNEESPLKLLSSSFSALARFEVGSEPARALRLRDSMSEGVWSEALAGPSSLFGFTILGYRAD